MAYHLLQQKRKEAEELVDALQTALRQVRHCARCNTFCEGGLCDICADETRDGRRLMVVHMPADVSNIEAANCHDGLYFVLMGQINTALGMDVSAIALDRLAQRLDGGEIEEIIIATAFTAEGNATAYVLSEFFKTCLTRSAGCRRASHWAANWNMSMRERWRRRCTNGV